MDDRIELRWRWLAVIAACACTLGVLLGLLAFPKVRPALLRQVDRAGETITVGGPFELTDHRGRRVSSRDFAGRPLVVAFGYARDPDQTPATLQLLARALERLGPVASRLVPLFITLDPAHDTPAVLSQLLAGYHPTLIGLTGTEADVVAVAKAFRLPIIRTPDADRPHGPAVTFDALIFLMNSQGVYVSHLDLDTAVEQVVHRLTELL